MARRLKIAGHCDQHQNLPAGKLVLWEPSHRQRERGQPTPTFVEALRMDAGVESSDGLACSSQHDGPVGLEHQMEDPSEDDLIYEMTNASSNTLVFTQWTSTV